MAQVQLVFTPGAQENYQHDGTTRSRGRLQMLCKLIQTYKDEDDVHVWFQDFIAQAGRSYLQENQGLIVSALMAKVPANTTFGNILRENYQKEWERVRIQSGLPIELGESDTANSLLTYMMHRQCWGKISDRMD